MSENLFSDGSVSAYAELPVAVAYLRWRRGNANMRSVVKSDPALYFGGWKANTKNRDGDENPVIPLPVVERVSEDGKYAYQAFASNVIEFLPIQHRTRFELREKSKDPSTGKDIITIRAIAKERRQGYTPVRQVFGLVYYGDDFAPAILYIDTWSAFISFERSGQKWGKVNVPSGKALVRRYGSVGVTDKESGSVLPNFETYGEARTTPIEAVGINNPRFVSITPDLMKLVEDSKAWRECSRWNAEGETSDVIGGSSAMSRYLAMCNELKLSNVDIDQILKENGNNYEAALKALGEGALENPNDINDINAALAEVDQNFNS